MQSYVQELIDEIMDNFDFDKVHKVMTFLNWTWWNAAEGVPSTSELRQQARRLLRDAVDKKSSISTGGLWARYKEYPEDDYPVSLELYFAVDHWDAYKE
jgi:hypothetical protein